MWALGVCAAYLIELVSPRWFTLRRVLALTLNFILLSVIYAITGSDLVFYIDLVYVVVFELALIGSILISLRRYNRYISDNYSNLERINVDWVYHVLIVFSVCVALWTLYLFNHNYLMKSLYYVVSIVAWSILISRSRTQMEITIDEPAEPIAEPQPVEQAGEEPAEIAQAESDTSQLSDQMKAQLDELMSVSKLYLNSRLTLTDLAAELGTNRTYLSNYLNRELNVSFYDYINAFRVKRACEMIDANPDVSVQTIVDSCGFNSVSTLRRSFTREIGQTYGEYRRKVTS